jgi:hypothetical protein
LNEEVRQELERLPADVRAGFERIVRLVQAMGVERVHEPEIIAAIFERHNQKPSP